MGSRTAGSLPRADFLTFAGVAGAHFRGPEEGWCKPHTQLALPSKIKIQVPWTHGLPFPIPHSSCFLLKAFCPAKDGLLPLLQEARRCQVARGTWAWHHKQEALRNSSVRRDSARAPCPGWREVPARFPRAWALPVRSTTQPGQEFSPPAPSPTGILLPTCPTQRVLRAPTAHSSPPSTSLPKTSQPALTTLVRHRAALSVCQTCEMLQPCVPCHCKRDLQVMWTIRPSTRLT